MVARIDNIFQSYDFSPEEYIAATTFSDLQTKYLQTELSIAATEKIHLAAVTPDQRSVDDITFRLAHEYCRGKIEMLVYLLQSSESRMEEASRLLREQAELQAELSRRQNERN